MAARLKRIVHDDNTRAKIKSSQIINRLQNHIFGNLKNPLQPSQVTAALGLLKKTLPDLQKQDMEHSGKMSFSNLTDEQLQAELATYLRKLG